MLNIGLHARLNCFVQISPFAESGRDLNSFERWESVKNGGDTISLAMDWRLLVFFQSYLLVKLISLYHRIDFRVHVNTIVEFLNRFLTGKINVEIQIFKVFGL